MTDYDPATIHDFGGHNAYAYQSTDPDNDRALFIGNPTTQDIYSHHPDTTVFLGTSDTPTHVDVVELNREQTLHLIRTLIEIVGTTP